MTEAGRRMEAPRPGGGQGGFTLLEVLVALTLLGFLLVGLQQGFRFGLKALDLQTKISSRTAELDAVDRALRRMIESMEPGDAAGTGKVMEGRRDRMTFLSTLPLAANIDRRARMTILVTPDKRLVLRWSPYRHEKPFQSPPPDTETLLLDHMERIDIAYWRPAALGIKGGWIDDWSLPGLPGLVRIRFSFPPGDPRHWPELIAAPALDPVQR